MKTVHRVCFVVLYVTTTAGYAHAGYTELVKLESFLAPGNAVQMQYSPDHKALFLRNSGSVIRVIDTSTRLQTGWGLANYLFTDMDLSPDGQYLYAADFGGEVPGSGTPHNTHYVHRYNLATRTWEASATPNVAFRIEAVDADRILLLSSNQWVSLTLNQWGSPVAQLSSRTFGMYTGDIAYDPATGRVLHTGTLLKNVTAFQIVGDSLEPAETSPGYSNPVGLAILSTDGGNFYSGPIQYDPRNVSIIRRTFPEAIHAASADIAFGQNGYYDAATGALLGNLGFSTQVYAVDAQGRELWAFDAATDMLHRYAIVPEPALAGMLCLGAALSLISVRRKRGS